MNIGDIIYYVKDHKVIEDRIIDKVITIQGYRYYTAYQHTFYEYFINRLVFDNKEGLDSIGYIKVK